MRNTAQFWPLVTVAAVMLGFAAGRWTSPVTSARSAPAPVIPSSAPVATTAEDPAKNIPKKNELPEPESWKTEWAKVSQQPPSAKRESDLAVLLERLAATDSDAALGHALAEPNLKVRSVLVGAALRGWGGAAPREAIAWSARHLDEQGRRDTHQALVAGLAASGQPPAPLLVMLCETDPDLASDYGIAFIGELARTNRFPEALQAALTAKADRLDHWVGTAFRHWAEYQPEEALKAVAAVTDPSARSTALQNIASGWAAASPAAMAQYAEQLPPGEWRQTVLREALQSWVKSDTAAAIKWIDRYDPEPALDSGAAAIATIPSLIAVKPAIAASWAESIVDDELRENAFGDVIRQWSQHDAAAARKYALSSKALSGDARSRLLDSLVPPSGAD
ncbi:MAG TPA: hypothetical protein VHO24_08790 [Opitutaceae bacterium]|nr:hypothetical protein [Opitutaceae bacterium]